MSDVWREVWPDARDAVSRARMAYLESELHAKPPNTNFGADADGNPREDTVSRFQPLRPSDRNLVPFEAIADAVWVDQDDDDCPLCSNPCISDPETT